MLCFVLFAPTGPSLVITVSLVGEAGTFELVHAEGVLALVTGGFVMTGFIS